MTELLRGRERRYFGYQRDTTHKIDTPESAKSFRSVMAPLTRAAQRQYTPVKTFRPDPSGRTRFADTIIHRAVKTQIPGLLPALKNSPQFEELTDNPIFLRSPDFEQHAGRSLHYMWLPKNDRNQLCQIWQRHLKTTQKARIRNVISLKKQSGLTGVAAEVAALEQQEYLESIAKDPRIMKNRQRRLSDVPSRILRQNRKFQASYWDPTYYKNLPDPFRRARNKVPAFDSICHEEFGQSPEYADLMTCVTEYNRRHQLNLELNADQLELEAAKEQARRLTFFGTLDDEERRRGIKHIKQLSEYDKESEDLWKKQAKLMISAAEYINKIKAGRRFPTPPKEIRDRNNRSGKKRASSPANSTTSSIDIDEYMEKTKAHSKTTDPKRPSTDEKRKRSRSSRSKKKAHYHHDYNSEEFYMEMYLHFLNPDEDVSLKRAQTQLTDIHELRKKMNLDEDHERDQKLVDMLNADSNEELHIDHHHRHSWDPHHTLSPDEKQQERDMLEEHLARLKNPRMAHMLTKMVSKMSLTSDMLRISSMSLVSTPSKKGEEEGTTTEPPTDSTAKTPGSRPEDMIDNDDDLDKMGDIPEHELKIIMSGIDVDNDNLSDSLDNLSSESSKSEEEEEGEDDDGKDAEEIKLFRTVKKKKDSMAEFMDLTHEFRQRVCLGEEGKPQALMNPFAEAVCVLYPDGSEKKTKKGKTNKTESITRL